MNVIDSMHHLVHDYPGGSESLGPRVGITPGVLRNKANPNCSTHHMTVPELDRLLGVTQNFAPLHALAANHGFGLYLLEGGDASAGLLPQLLATNAAKGEFAQALQAALSDGVVTGNEYQALVSAGNSVQSCMVMLLNKLRDAAQSRKPAEVG